MEKRSSALILNADGTILSNHIISGHGCFITPPVTMDSPGLPPDFEPTGTHLFPDYKFYCSGLITGWNIRTLAPGKITLSIWRRFTNDSQGSANHQVGAYQRVGAVELVLQDGFNYINFAVGHQMEVTAGDILGLQYKSNESNAVIAYDHWACEFGFPCHSEDIFIPNEYPNSLMNSTTRLTSYGEGETRSGVYYLSRFTLFGHSTFFPKIIPIIVERGNFSLRFIDILFLSHSHANVIALRPSYTVSCEAHFIH